jgi:hypothetical protein
MLTMVPLFNGDAQLCNPLLLRSFFPSLLFVPAFACMFACRPLVGFFTNVGL